MIIPRRVRKGEDVTAELYNTVVDAVIERTPLLGPNGRIKGTPRGFITIPDPSAGRKGGGSVITTPWQISVDGNADDGFNAHVRPGTVDELVPSNIFDPFPLSSGANWLKLQCDTDGKAPNAITILCESSPTNSAALVASNTAPSSFYIMLGVVVQSGSGDTTSNQIIQIRSANIAAIPVIAFLEPQTPSSPGDEGFKRWWMWQISDSE